MTRGKGRHRVRETENMMLKSWMDKNVGRKWEELEEEKEYYQNILQEINFKE